MFRQRKFHFREMFRQRNFHFSKMFRQRKFYPQKNSAATNATAEFIISYYCHCARQRLVVTS